MLVATTMMRASEEEENIERGAHGSLKVLDNKPVVAGAVVSPNRLAYSVGERKSKNCTHHCDTFPVCKVEEERASTSLPVVP